MAQILVRNLDDGVVERLKIKAELAGKSLEQFMREQIVNLAPLSPSERVAVSRRLRAMQPAALPEIAFDEIRDGLQ